MSNSWVSFWMEIYTGNIIKANIPRSYQELVVYFSKKGIFYLLHIRIFIFLILPAWSHCLGEVHTKPIYLLQKKVVRAFAFKSFSSPSTPIFSDLKILKLNDLFELKAAYIYL